MNNSARLYTSTHTRFDLEGKYDCEFPTSWAEYADDFMMHDKLAEKSTQSVIVIETDFWYNSSYLVPYISSKIPLRNKEGICVGTLWNARRIKVVSPLVFIGEKKPSVLQTSVDEDMFTKAELDIIFFLLKRLSRKEIANCLNLSTKTIDNSIQNMYRKCDVHSLSQFESYCRELNLHDFVPSRLLNKGILFI